MDTTLEYGALVLSDMKRVSEATALLKTAGAEVMERDGDPTARSRLYSERVDAFAVPLRNLPQTPLPITHHHAPGVYIREGVLLKDNIYIGHAHRHEHMNVFLTGRALLYMDGEVSEIVAPCFVKSKAGVRKILYILDDLRGANIHANPTDEQDMEKLGPLLIEKSQSFLAYEEQRKLT
jgi:hypothetical protein